jgi:long-chain acyl-CoA synthetase
MPDRPFSVCMERWMSYGELDALSKALGAWLQSRGLEPGARVAIMLPNIPQFAVTMCGVLRAGYTCVNVNPLYTARELEHQLKDSGATAIVILENFASTLEKVIERTPVKHVVMTSMGDLLGGLYGAWITLAVRHLAKMVPPYKLPLDEGRTVTPFTQAIAEGAGARWARPEHARLGRVPAVHRRHDRAVEGRGADPSQHRRRPRCRPRPGSRRRWRAPATSRRSTASPRCRCITSSR